MKHTTSVAESPAGTGQRSGGSRRSAIIDAALTLFYERGYSSTTMEDIGRGAGIAGPSIYKHFTSKQAVLVEITQGTMRRLLDLFARGMAETKDGTRAQQLARATELHVRYHAQGRREAFIGNRELRSLESPYRDAVLGQRRKYENDFRRLIAKGAHEGAFQVSSVRLASYAIVEMGMGVATWFNPDGPLSEDEVAKCYALMALRIVGADALSMKELGVLQLDALPINR